MYRFHRFTKTRDARTEGRSAAHVAIGQFEQAWSAGNGAFLLKSFTQFCARTHVMRMQVVRLFATEYMHPSRPLPQLYRSNAALSYSFQMPMLVAIIGVMPVRVGLACDTGARVPTLITTGVSDHYPSIRVIRILRVSGSEPIGLYYSIRIYTFLKIRHWPHRVQLRTDDAVVALS